MKTLFLRSETYPNEYRTPLTPPDIRRLIQQGHTVYVESSKDRVYRDEEYVDAGAILTTDDWTQYNQALIVGIKEIENLEQLNGHTHAYFSHSFKGQLGSKEILDAFRTSNSILYDFEYFLNETGHRKIAFGWYAGAAGAVLGLLQYSSPLGPLRPWSSIEAMLESVPKLPTPPRIAVVGAKGRCGSGVCDVLMKLQIPFQAFGRTDDPRTLRTYDILYNCVLLDESSSVQWFNPSTELDHPIVIVDISCDYSKKNNPIAVYEKATTWTNPVVHPLSFLSVIAIENLPSLLPKESSEHFSALFTSILLEDMDVMERALEVTRRHLEDREA